MQGPDTVDSKITGALGIMLDVFLWFDRQFLSSSAFYEQNKDQRPWFDKHLFHKTALDTSFLTRIISSARIILLPTVLVMRENNSNGLKEFRISKVQIFHYVLKNR